MNGFCQGLVENRDDVGDDPIPSIDLWRFLRGPCGTEKAKRLCLGAWSGGSLLLSPQSSAPRRISPRRLPWVDRFPHNPGPLVDPAAALPEMWRTPSQGKGEPTELSEVW